MTAKYDATSVDSIVGYAHALTGKTLNEVVTLPHQVENAKNKGDLGGLVEAHFFDLPKTNSDLDFPAASLELKTTGVKKRSDGRYQAKERLVLTMINFMDLVGESWLTSNFYKKCKLMLILFYLYEKDVPVFDQRFVLPPFLYKLDEHDAATIKQDWEYIKQKVADGKAHELSEGDTFYLGACRKGAGGPDEPLRKQPFSSEGAKARAFSFKTNYLNALIEGHASSSNGLSREGKTIYEATQERFEPYLGLSLEEISNRIGYFKSGPNHKGFVRDLMTRVLARGGSSVPELDRAGIEMKTIRLNKNGVPKEHMSFPGFKFTEIVEEEWEQSSFFEKLESKFLFIVFQEDRAGIERFRQALYWNMPYEDRLEAKRVWEDTKNRVQNAVSIMPKASESYVAHVRPKGRDGTDKIITPHGSFQMKQCFWLNAKYLEQVLTNN